ncbi:RNA-binding S4 domain-containing protein [Paucibacter sp. O1-1]|uniref:RNA-binding S4 domain-containing protein n=1 Tax=Roseateles TaxID=93681 RepID=UPI0021D4F319|nr:RNA-binding S4 domain-containing protein [Paucibacter sp. PLA-PC-4]MCU7371344.1 RNA-binding S4 domain-containing protein [Paucibacter sp. O1-1]MCX2862791.1 RNA-binding S4 domain-containing protein [Paucibacter sp. PLA-PC-4]MDA3826333.1 RNA-binding S4 domain-containing protein [Paucibacter sp. O1-1]
MEHINFELRGEFIELDKLLKATGLADSGGVARMMITEQQVQVDGQTELRKTAKIRAGQVVSLQGARIKVLADPLQD